MNCYFAVIRCFKFIETTFILNCTILSVSDRNVCWMESIFVKVLNWFGDFSNKLLIQLLIIMNSHLIRESLLAQPGIKILELHFRKCRNKILLRIHDIVKKVLLRISPKILQCFEKKFC